MKTLFFDCFSGISGDMLLGTLIDLGVDPERLSEELRKLHVDGYQLNFTQKMTSGISGTDADVQLSDDSSPDQMQQHAHAHHDHSAHSRNLEDCLAIINGSSLSDRVKSGAAGTFKEIACAEAHVHNKPVQEVHFHEIGAVDSIVDIVGTFIGLELLGVEKVFASVLHDGNGFINCAHGVMPVPVPAVAQMLASSERRIPYVQEDIPTELITPTGMAIIKTIAADFGKMPLMDIKRIGYGTGKRQTGRMNALRGILGEMKENVPENPVDEIMLLEANIDNQNGEMLGYTMNRLFDEGALDVFFTPIYMKKNRPAAVLSVLAKPEDVKKMTQIIFEETTTLGVRTFPCSRYTMNREFRTVQTKFGKVRVKHAFLKEIEKDAPEYEDCVRLAKAHALPLHQVYDSVYDALNNMRAKMEDNPNE
ncbi:nickel pincer cofactor biosynthesis protein LarC [Sporolactobacillus sp. CQH2019]|uniref:nickel pincer cofactor biosynthesis protein LarC n=1 Tax=Sporolactobacillus sp. CQH2019 TaxID=3023512 RepID=UPI0023688137|nr:nickel pincer cofactor biosynthesis protein LarC [Sporolactobacillus sp. CQH2019]MDD9149648.1 nickel pincer cofactor biosynthesis protein LarC [Sporolactobacillus sp. CQH2019]